ncbi:MAG: TetR/AcrR family transcriptional regulator [Pseudomonadota bacterium]
MPRPSVTPEQRSDMRQRIRDAALRVIRRMKVEPGDVRGYEQVTIRDVIEEAGVSIGTFYKYFDSRSDLGQSLWSEPVDQLRAEMQADYDRQKPPPEKVRVLLEHYVRFAFENRRVFRGAFLFVRQDGAEKGQSIKLEDEALYRNLCEAFREGQDKGLFRDFDVHDMAQTVWAGIHGSLALPVNLDRLEFDSAEDLSSRMIDAMLDLITAK